MTIVLFSIYLYSSSKDASRLRRVSARSPNFSFARTGVSLKNGACLRQISSNIRPSSRTTPVDMSQVEEVIFASPRRGTNDCCFLQPEKKLENSNWNYCI